MKTIYLAGPMRGLPFFGFPLFDDWAYILRANGHRVFNPAEHDRQCLGLDPAQFPNGDFRDAGWSDAQIKHFMRRALAWDTARICESDAIALMPGWEESTGVMAIERPLAMVLGLEEIIL